MDIVLDSNIFRGDWYLKSNDFTILIRIKNENAKTVFYVSAVFTNDEMGEMEISDFIIRRNEKFGYF